MDIINDTIAAIMARSKAASGTAVFVDPVILRQILQPLLDEIVSARSAAWNNMVVPEDIHCCGACNHHSEEPR